ncbi:MAG: alpha/beta hydrolase [Halobacteriota archaeon]
MEPHPDIERMLDMADEYDISLHDETVEDSRMMMERLSQMAAGQPPGDVETQDVSIEFEDVEVDARVYDDGDGDALVFYHGGGFVLGGLDTHDQLCRLLADETGLTVVSVDYSLAPEHPFPAAVEDAYGALRWASARYGDVAVAGDSAGGTLSAVVSMMARDRGIPDVSAQCLLYPATAYMDAMPSRGENATGYLLEAQDMLWFVDQYVDSDLMARHPYAFPLQARSLEDVAPAFVLTAGFDPLRDEGRAYAERLEGDGVEVVHSEYDDMIHGFLNMDGLVDAAGEAVEEIADFLDEHVG